jgi:CBS domain-containing protein
MEKPNLKVGDVMTVGVVSLPETSTVQQAAKQLKRTKVGSIIVTRKGKAVGIVTERDIAYKVVAEGKNASKTMLKSIMSRPLRVIRTVESIQNAATALATNKVKRLPVVDKKGQLVGIISDSDLMRAYPGLVDVLMEEEKLELPKNEFYTGVCAICGLVSEDLKRYGNKLVCEECAEEEEV